MAGKNTLFENLFLSLSISDFSFLFYVKTATLPEKSHSYVSQQQLSEILKSEN